MSRACAFVLGLFLSLQVHAASLLASVDRTRLNAGETLELTLQTQDVTQFGKPDLSPLEANFDVRDTRQVNSLNSLDDHNTAGTRWIITLLPRQSGSVEIPALQMGELRSEPISLQVLAQEASSENHGPVFIDASLDQPEVYVQAQAVLTLSIYHSVPLYDDSSLSPLQIDNAKVEPLGESRTFEKVIDGVRHGVIEMRYAIYPQHSGDLNIPALAFSATAAQNDADQELSSPRAGKQVRVSSTPLVLTVNPIPSDYPANAPWLPTNNLSLEEHWSPDPGQQQIQIGDSLTRTVTVQAEGLSSAQLPPLPVTEVTGLRRYPDQPQLRNQVNDRGLLGIREEREALVPTHSGTLELPAQEVFWWNTREDHLEHSSLPARSLQIQDNPALSADKPANIDPVSVTTRPLWPWQLSTLLLALSTLAGFTLWWRARSQPAVLRAAQAGPSPRTLLDDLKRACQANDPQATRQALDAWARQQPETLAEMAARFVPLSDALDGLNGALYSESGHYWQGDELWRAIGTIPAAEQIQPTVSENGSLPPLYPK
ncbi:MULTISPECIES: BatD family protein [Pseudomonas]|uniref:BatD family protein n=1 Tax=Pseudomonas sp. Hg7Tf TaxID=3236988 RepID=A0AB39I605_9PSED|nr:MULTISPECIES: BatD family protein [Pseudomonas]KJK06507.1 protein BatD [Pseudomonas sp. 5]MDD1976652.1 BatD family protein [Pseudomonas putida]MDH2557962.1 BatD family protein [Pseudomonas sp. Hg5Tf]QYX47872.1 BatD family protein [Pseudomonas sp. S11A 273]